jgi:transcription elongation factor GreB
MTLLDVDRPKVVETVSWAAKNGDRSENGDYLYGKKRLREIDRRIRFLSKRLDIAEVADPGLHHGNDQVFFGATVTYANAKGDERTVTIKGIDEADSLAGEVSWISPDRACAAEGARGRRGAAGHARRRGAHRDRRRALPAACRLKPVRA